MARLGIGVRLQRCRLISKERPLAGPFSQLRCARGAADHLLFLGFTNRSVMRSLSPIATYFARSVSLSASVGGSVHTPSGQSVVSFGFAFTSEAPSKRKPAFSARARTVDTLI